MVTAGSESSMGATPTNTPVAGGTNTDANTPTTYVDAGFAPGAWLIPVVVVGGLLAVAGVAVGVCTVRALQRKHNAVVPINDPSAMERGQAVDNVDGQTVDAHIQRMVTPVTRVSVANLASRPDVTTDQLIGAVPDLSNMALFANQVGPRAAHGDTDGASTVLGSQISSVSSKYVQSEAYNNQRPLAPLRNYPQSSVETARNRTAAFMELATVQPAQPKHTTQQARSYVSGAQSDVYNNRRPLQAIRNYPQSAVVTRNDDAVIDGDDVYMTAQEVNSEDSISQLAQSQVGSLAPSSVAKTVLTTASAAYNNQRPLAPIPAKAFSAVGTMKTAAPAAIEAKKLPIIEEDARSEAWL